MGAPEENLAVGQVEGRLAGRFPSLPSERIHPMEIERREREHRGGFLFGDLGGGPS